jgi:hypothetical protein
MECFEMSDNVHKAFVESFTDYWAAPSAERMPEILTNDVVLSQPLSYPMEGLAAAQDEFRRLFKWIPDLRGEIKRWGDTGIRCSSILPCPVRWVGTRNYIGPWWITLSWSATRPANASVTSIRFLYFGPSF